MRILHCPNSVGGHPHGLAKAERKLGQESFSLAYHETAFGHSCDECLWKEGMSPFYKEMSRWQLLFKAFFSFDVIHYNFGTPILRWQYRQQGKDLKSKGIAFLYNAYVRFCYFIERQLLKNKVIAVTYQGDDARQGDYSLASFKYSIAQEVDASYYSKRSDQEKRETIEKFDRMADIIYSLNPDLLHVLPARSKFMPYAHIDLHDWEVIEHPRSAIPIVLHAPSHSGAKGTRFILAAVSQLQKEGLKFEFILVENMKNSQARKLYETCDLVIDQLLAGWYGGFAVEAMALGKPVICYIRHEDTHFIPAEMKKDLPLIEATPDSICDILREWISQRVHELPERGIASRAFVEKWHNPTMVAARHINDYENCN